MISLTTFAFGIFVVVLAIVIAHYGALAYFLRTFHRTAWRRSSGPFTPKAAVLLTLRGADPFLDRCLSGLLRQDYPDYRVFLVVDSADDPALTALAPLLAGAPNGLAETVVVEEHLQTCSLKNNSLCHIIERLDPSFEIVAMIDADVCPHRTWLRELTAPFFDAGVGAATGQRWYIPQRANCGSLIRYLWNAAAIVQMILHTIPWGGTLAFRRKIVDRPEFLASWRRSITDDVSALKLVRAAGKRAVFVPALLMVNREVCMLRAFYPWVKRQLLMAKLYHPAWGPIVAQAIFLTLPLLGAAAAIVGGFLIPGERMAAVWGASAILLYSVGVTAALGIMERGVRKELRKRDEPLTRPTVSFVVKSLGAILLTQMVYTSAMIGMYRLKRVEWRGVEYEIGRDKSIRLLKYIPYAQVEKKRETDASPTSL